MTAARAIEPGARSTERWPASRPGRPLPPGLRCRVRLAGRASVLRRAAAGAPPGAAARSAARRDTDGLVELTAGHPAAGRKRRDRPPHAGASTSCPAARAGRADGSRPAGARRADRRRRLRPPRFDGRAAARRCSSGRAARPAARAASTPSRRPGSCGSTSTAPSELPALWAFLAERPCHLLIESGAGQAACTPTGSSTGRSRRSRVNERPASRSSRSSAPPQADPPPRRRPGRQAERRGPGVSRALAG